MISFAFILAVIPIAVYCIVLGGLSWRKRPHAVNGGRDLACLGLATTGLFLIGPAELLFPQAAYNVFGVSVWAVILVLYSFIILFVVLNTKPRLIVMGLSIETLIERVDFALQELDPGTKWLGTSFVAPDLGIQGLVERAGIGHVCHIVATRREQELGGWVQLQRALNNSLRESRAEQSPEGKFWLAIGCGLLCLSGYIILTHSPSISQGIHEMLRY